MTNGYVSLVVGKPSVAYAAKTGGGTIANIYEINLLAAGAIAFFTEENKLITTSTSTADLLGTQQFFMAMGSVDGKSAIKTVNIDRNAFHFLKKAFAAATKQKDFVGENSSGTGSMNLPSALTTDMIAVVKVVDNTSGSFKASQTKTYEIPVLTGDDTDAIVDRMVALINADASSIVTATAIIDTTSVGFSLEAKDANTSFITLLSEIFEASSLDTGGANNGGQDSIVAFPGQGILSQIQQIEDMADISTRGQVAQGGQSALWWKQPSEVDATGATSSTQWITYDIMWQAEHNTGFNIRSAALNRVVLALVTGEAAVTSVDTIFTTLMQAAETGSGGSAEGEFSD